MSMQRNKEGPLSFKVSDPGFLAEALISTYYLAKFLPKTARKSKNLDRGCVPGTHSWLTEWGRPVQLDDTPTPIFEFECAFTSCEQTFTKILKNAHCDSNGCREDGRDSDFKTCQRIWKTKLGAKLLMIIIVLIRCSFMLFRYLKWLVGWGRFWRQNDNILHKSWWNFYASSTHSAICVQAFRFVLISKISN